MRSCCVWSKYRSAAPFQCRLPARVSLRPSVPFVCLFVCNIFTCQQYFMPTVRCIRMRQQLPLPLPPAPLLCRLSLDATRNRPKNVAQVERQLHTTTAAMTTACNIHACLPQFACCFASPAPPAPAASSLLVGFSCKIAHMSYVISVACPCVAIAIASALRATK